MILHTVNKSPYLNSCLENCLNLAMAGDTVILIEDGVYGATLGQSSTLIKIRENIIKLVEAEVMFFALQPDFEARGLDRISLMQHFTLVDDSGFVELAVQADKTLSWY